MTPEISSAVADAAAYPLESPTVRPTPCSTMNCFSVPRHPTTPPIPHTRSLFSRCLNATYATGSKLGRLGRAIAIACQGWREGACHRQCAPEWVASSRRMASRSPVTRLGMVQTPALLMATTPSVQVPATSTAVASMLARLFLAGFVSFGPHRTAQLPLCIRSPTTFSAPSNPGPIGSQYDSSL